MKRGTAWLVPLLLAACAPGGTSGNDSADGANGSVRLDSSSGSRPSPPPPGSEETIRADIPANFHGRFDSSAEACGRSSERRLLVEGGALRFHESIGTVRKVAVHGPHSLIVSADYQGEGESWSNVRRLDLSEDASRLTLSGEGPAISWIRCPADEAWKGSASGEGAGLSLAGAAGKPAVTLFCPAGRPVLIVNVPAFRPIGSEERMSFGAGGTAVTLVADARGDRLRGGVSGEAPVPAELAEILASASGIAVNYGAQNLGPLSPVPGDLAKALVAGCRD